MQLKSEIFFLSVNRNNWIKCVGVIVWKTNQYELIVILWYTLQTTMYVAAVLPSLNQNYFQEEQRIWDPVTLNSFLAPAHCRGLISTKSTQAS
jgi:hypothetical protein